MLLGDHSSRQMPDGVVVRVALGVELGRVVILIALLLHTHYGQSPNSDKTTCTPW